MGTVTAILNHVGSGNATSTINPLDSTSSSSNEGQSGTSAAISSNDFLTLLVTEMKNQDPTATTDPNEYINQLVNVNSLQQLISINQTLSGALGSSGAADPSAGVSVPDVLANDVLNHARSMTSEAHPNHAFDTRANLAGNLSIPNGSSAAKMVSDSLGGK